jgi:hypothetical protein
MAKHTYYFNHDFNAHNDEKIIDLRMDHGMEGYGVYWYIIELLANSDGYKLDVNYKRIAFNVRTEEGTIKAIIEDYDLFTVENGVFWSESLVDRLSALDEIKKKRSEAGRKGAMAKHKQTHSKGVAEVQKVVANSSRGEERREKERKGDKSKELKTDILAEYLAIWNDSLHTKNYSPISSAIKAKLNKNISAREKEISDFKGLFKKAISQPQQQYVVDGGWFTFEWCFKSPVNAEKLVSGNYTQNSKRFTE